MNIIKEVIASMERQQYYVSHKMILSEIMEMYYERDNLELNSIPERYALLFYFATYVLYNTEKYNVLDAEDIFGLEKVKNYMHISMESKINQAMISGGYMPEWMQEVYGISDEIFEMAIKSYTSGEISEEDIKKGEELQRKIEAYEEKFVTYDCPYRDVAELKMLYDMEVSECGLDMEVIRGFNFLFSRRMYTYIRESAC